MDILNKIKLILLKPDKFFSGLKEKTVQDALLYYIILLAFNTIMSYLMFLIFGDAITKTIMNIFGLNSLAQQLNSVKLFGTMVLGFIFGVLFTFVMAGILYVWLLIFKGDKGYNKAYQLYIYSETPSLTLKWIPFLGFFTWIYDLILLIIGTKKIYNFSTTKSVLIYIIPLALIFIMGLFFLFGVLSLLALRNYSSLAY
jgi:hypothetical protein